MSKHTDSPDGGAMPAEGRSDASIKIADEIDVIKDLVDAAFMAAGDLDDSHRSAMRGLLDVTSTKLSAVAKEFADAYCGGYANV